MKTSIRLIVIVWLAIALVACGGSEATEATDVVVSDATATREPTKIPTQAPIVEEPTAVPEPTATPLPEPTATAIPEPTETPVIGTPMNFDEIGVGLNVPDGWDSADFFGTVFISRNDDEDNAIIVIAEPLEEGDTIDSMFEEMQSEITEDEAVTFGERVELSINGLDGFEVDITEESEGVTSYGRLAFLTDGIHAAVIVGRGTLEAWESGQSEALDTLVQTISLYAPVVVDESAESASEEAVEDDNGQQATDVADDSAAPGKTSGAAAVAVSSEAGMACFGTSGEGMSCISAEGEWQTYTEDNSQISSDYITNMVSCNEGTILIAHSSDFSIFDGETFRRFEAGWGYSSPDDLVCDSEGGIWAAHFEGVSYFDGESWTTWDSDTYFAEDSLVNAVKVAPDGTVWIAASNTLASFDGANWTTFEEADFGDLTFFDTLVVDSSGVVWATTSDGLLYSEDGGWTSIESPNYFSAETLIIDKNGDKWLGTFNDGIELFESGTWLTIDRQNNGLSSDRINDMVYDGNARLWVATDYGITVLDGESNTIYRMDNAPLIGNEINSLAILGGGPMLPELVTFTPGGIEGAIVEEGASVANRTIEICVESIYSSFDGATPCEGQPLAFSTTTDEAGAFSFSDVPVGRYVVLAETDEGWAQMTNEFGFSSQMVPVDAGEITDLGELVITDDE